MPIRQGDIVLLLSFESYFNTLVSEIVPLSAEVMDHAAEIRAFYGFRTPDAVHLAAATVSGCDTFLTNDHRLDRFTGIPVEIVQP
ncbi:MAG: PIN domain-containing protein [Armatimonadetes bacterium]|nr:PIN domain-containing protein [Armatimonadota bacterium]